MIREWFVSVVAEATGKAMLTILKNSGVGTDFFPIEKATITAGDFEITFQRRDKTLEAKWLREAKEK